MAPRIGLYLMPAIIVNKVKPGMRLARPVMTGGGKVFLRGEVLDEAAIAELRKSNLWYVWVEEHPQTLSRRREGDMEREVAELEERFRKVAGYPLNTTIKELLKAHLRQGGP